VLQRCKTHQAKATSRLEKTRREQNQDKTRQGKTKQNKQPRAGKEKVTSQQRDKTITRQGSHKKRQGKTRQGRHKTRQDKTVAVIRQDKIRREIYKTGANRMLGPMHLSLRRAGNTGND
jgi:hypothetical protein